MNRLTIVGVAQEGDEVIKPQPLLPGQCVGVFAPSEPITETRTSRLERGISILESHGFSVEKGAHIYHRRYYTAGTPSERVDDIHRLAEADQVKALMAAWGGKSANQLLGLLDYKLIAASRKAILGFSDGGVLLNAITAQTGLITFYGPNVVGKLFETQHSDLRLLRGEMPFKNLLGSVEKVEHKVIRGGRARGTLFGGNLSTFTLGCIGSQFMPASHSGIFFWESGGERLQIVDQYLTCLRNEGVFERLAGMIIGDFIHDDPNDYRYRDPFEMVQEIVDGYRFPVLYCPTFGHPGHLENPILPIGALCEVSSEDMSLSALESVVA